MSELNFVHHAKVEYGINKVLAAQIHRSHSIVWAIIAVSLVGFAAACWARGFSMNLIQLLPIIATIGSCLFGAFFLRRRGWQRLPNYLVSFAQMTLLTAVLTPLTYVLASTNLPLHDEYLIKFDSYLGLEWNSLIYTFMNYPLLMTILNYAYASFNYQIILIFPILFLCGDGRIGAQLLVAWSVAFCATVLIFPFIPAAGGFIHYGIEPKDLPQVRVQASWLYFDLFNAARLGDLKTIELDKLDGIITFPSFHAVVAILIGWASWSFKYILWPVTALNVLMWVSAIPIGGHYIADIISGSIIAVASLCFVRWLDSAQLYKTRSARGLQFTS